MTSGEINSKIGSIVGYTNKMIRIAILFVKELKNDRKGQLRGQPSSQARGNLR